MSQVPIGKPFKDLKIKFDDENQLFIGGKIISPGYLDKSGNLNKNKFSRLKNMNFYNTGIFWLKKIIFIFVREEMIVKLKLKDIESIRLKSKKLLRN